jgi:hypothetical protein
VIRGTIGAQWRLDTLRQTSREHPRPRAPSLQHPHASPPKASPAGGTELPRPGLPPDAYGAVEGGLFGLLLCCPPPCWPPPQLPELPAQANEGLSSSGPVSELAELVQLARLSARSAPKGRSVRMVRSPTSYLGIRRARRCVLRQNRRRRKACRAASVSRQLTRKKRWKQVRERIVIVVNATTQAMEKRGHTRSSHG